MSVTFSTRPVRQEANFANANARDLLALLGEDPAELWGDWTWEQLPAVQQRIMVAINSAKRRSHLVRETETGGGPGTGSARWITFGNTDDQTVRRLQDLRAVITVAQDNHQAVTWG